MTRKRALALRAKIEQASASLPDEDALEAVELFPKWTENVDYPADKRLQHEGKLWKVRQAHKSSSLFPPGSLGSEALYAEVEKPGQGDSPDNPILYNNNMELKKGKYYSQSGVVYICFRDTGVPVYNDLSALVEIYVRVWTE